MKMSVTRALSELKHLNDRIYTATNAGFVQIVQGRTNETKKVLGLPNVKVEAVENEIRAAYQKVQTLIQNQQKIRAAVIASNAATVVTVAGKEMTVAEAIEMKRSINHKKVLCNTLISQYNTKRELVERSNNNLEEEINKLLVTVYGADRSKFDQTTVDTVGNPQRDKKESSLIDPINVADTVKKLQEEISNFENEVDFVLSESNSQTAIEVDI